MGKLKLIFGVLVLFTSIFFGSLFTRGPNSSFICSIIPSHVKDLLHVCPPPIIQGWTTEKFTPVKRAFASNFEEFREAGSQLTIYHNGEKVVDLWGADPATAPNYNNQSLQRVYSSGKMVEVLVALICVDRGLIKFEDTIASKWPEFGQKGKAQITLGQLMRHEAGLSHLGDVKVNLTILREYTKGNFKLLGEIIEEAPLAWPETTKRAYHSQTRGWVLSELVRRIDPKNRPIHEFIRDEIAQPMEIDLYFVPQDKIENVVSLVKTPGLWMMANVMLPFFLGDHLTFLPKVDTEIKDLLAGLMSGKNTFLPKATVFNNEGTDMNDPTQYLFYDVFLGSSFGGVGTGSALGALASVFANGGLYKTKNIRFFKESTWKYASECSEETLDAGLGMNTQFALGGFACPKNDWAGWCGWGGSQLKWITFKNEKTRQEDTIALGYAVSRMGYHLSADERFFKIVEGIQESLQ